MNTATLAPIAIGAIVGVVVAKYAGGPTALRFGLVAAGAAVGSAVAVKVAS